MRPVLVYDGDCGFCSACARAVRRWVPTLAEVVPWQQADLARLGLTPAEAAHVLWWVADDGSRSAGPEAVAALLRSSHRGWRVVGRVLAWPPVRAVAWPVYRWVARNRHRLPGRGDACAVTEVPARRKM